MLFQVDVLLVIPKYYLARMDLAPRAWQRINCTPMMIRRRFIMNSYFCDAILSSFEQRKPAHVAACNLEFTYGPQMISPASFAIFLLGALHTDPDPSWPEESFDHIMTPGH